MNDAREFHDGQQDGLVALESLDLDKVRSFAGLLRAMSRTAFSGRSLGEALDVTVAMVKDPDCKVVLTLSGAMTIAKMGRDHLEDDRHRHGARGRLDRRAHGPRHVGGGGPHALPPRPDDVGRGAVREGLQPGLRHARDGGEPQLRRGLHLEGARPAGETRAELSSEIINRTLGEVLAEDPKASGVLRSAYLKNVPVYVPAFTDSELGLDLSTWAMKKRPRARREATR